MGFKLYRNESLKLVVKRHVRVAVILATCLVGLVHVLGSVGATLHVGALGSNIRRMGLGDDSQMDCILDRDVTVSVAGLPRSGSTIAYNMVRMVLTYYQPSLLYEWIDELISNKTMRDYVSKDHHNISIVYKTHILDEQLVQNSDLVIFTHRDPIEQVCSLGLMFDEEILTNCTHAQAQCRWMESTQRDLYNNVTGRPIIDFDYAELSNPALLYKAVDKLADELSIHAGCIAPSFYNSFSRLRPPKEGVFSVHHPFTIMHAGHIHASTSQCDGFHACLVDDSDCKAWISRGGTIHV